VLIGGYGPDYDLITPVRMTSDGLRAAGPQARLVLPDGMEVYGARLSCRGPELHAIVRGSWYRTDLNQLSEGA